METDDDFIMPPELFIPSVFENPYIPHVPFDAQIEFLELECPNALYGGAAGGGKSDALLMAALQFCNDFAGLSFRGYSALIVRRSLKELTLSGGLMDRALEWLRPHLGRKGKGGKVLWNGADYKLSFPNGSTIQFGYCDNPGDELRYHGSEYQLVALDEAVQFTPEQIMFFATERIRKKVGLLVPERFRMGTTPGGVSHAFIKQWFIDPGTPGDVFVRATARDNPHVGENYIDRLKMREKTDPLRYRQMAEGDWTAVDGGRFKQDWFGRWETDRHLADTVVLRDSTGAEVERFRPEECGRFQTCDPAISTSNKADHFVLSTFMLSPKANLVWWHCQYGRYEMPEQVRLCQSLYRRFRPQFLGVEDVGYQKGLIQTLQRSSTPVMVVKPLRTGNQDKLARAAGAMSLAASRRVFLPAVAVSAEENPVHAMLSELVSFTGEKKGKDDVTDTLSYATMMLTFVRPGSGPNGPRAPFRYEPRDTRHPAGAPRG